MAHSNPKQYNDVRKAYSKNDHLAPKSNLFVRGSIEKPKFPEKVREIL